jgi:phasin family protein
MSKVLNDTLNANSASAESMSNLSAVYMDGVMRLSALGISTCRETFDACSAALSQANGGQAATSLPAVLGQAALDKSVEYSRSAYEIIASTQEQLTRTLLDQFSRINIGTNMPETWSAIGDMTTKGSQQFTDVAANNVRAAADAGSDVVTKVTQQAKRVA